MLLAKGLAWIKNTAFSEDYFPRWQPCEERWASHEVIIFVTTWNYITFLWDVCKTHVAAFVCPGLAGRTCPTIGTEMTPSWVLQGSLSTIWQACSDFPKANVKILWGLFGPKVKSRISSHRTFSWKERKVTGFLFLFFFFLFREFLTCFFLFSFILGDSRNDTQPPHNLGALCAELWYIYWEIFNK